MMFESVRKPSILVYYTFGLHFWRLCLKVFNGFERVPKYLIWGSEFLLRGSLIMLTVETISAYVGGLWASSAFEGKVSIENLIQT